MNKIYLFNTLGREKQEFHPIDKGEVRMYTCGPTVYNYLHIGNLRAYVFADILKRTLRYNGYKVKHIMNVTDVGHLTSDADSGDDKMVKALIREGKPLTIDAMRSVADQYFAKAQVDMDKLGIIPADKYPFATDHIKEMTEMIITLLERGAAYKTKSSIYFDTKSINDYGKLGGASGKDEHSRIGVDPDKKNPEDFALWKFSDESGIGFDAPFGKGFPGWHIECSAMSEKYLGVPFDIHTGGVDHIQVHHNNEIAQTEAATGKDLAHYWLHNEHLTLGDQKMAKSGDFLTLSVLEKEGIDPLAYRYWLLTSRYSTRMDYSLEAIRAAQSALTRLRNNILNIIEGINNKVTQGSVIEEYKQKFTQAINDDLDTPKAIAVVWEMVQDQNISRADKQATFFNFDNVLGFDFLSSAEFLMGSTSPEIQVLLNERKLARDKKDWKRSDELREQIRTLGYNVKDSDSGQEVSL